MHKEIFQSSPETEIGADFLEDLTQVRDSLESSRLHIHGFMKNFFKVGQMDEKVAYRLLGEIVEQAKVFFLDMMERRSEDLPVRTIPKTFHRVWLTSPSRPVEPPAKYISGLIKEADAYAGLGWSHQFWIQDEAWLPATLDAIRSSGSPIDVCIIRNRIGDGNWAEIYNAFIASDKFPFAADVLRMKILLDFGGIYADLGASITSIKAADCIVSDFDYAFIFWETMFFQNSLMAMAQGSDIARIFMRLVERPYSIPDRLIAPLTGISEGMVFSGLMITCILLTIYEPSMRICPLAPNGRIVSWSSEQSWYTDCGDGRGKHGNAYVPSTGPSFFRPELMSTGNVDPIFAPRSARDPGPL